jgi:type IV pilus assembly protein PilO
MAFSSAVADLKNINFEEDLVKRIGTAPIIARILVVVLAAVTILGLMWHFMITPQFGALKTAEMKEVELRTIFDHESAKAANRGAYVEQLEEMKKTFNVMLRQLPNETDIESLLVDLSQTSVASGLDVEYFKPELEVPREFYAEYPIKISVTGGYHQFGQFVSGLAALPRIVTLSNIEIRDSTESERQRNGQDIPLGKKLKMDLTATTYRYIEEE